MVASTKYLKMNIPSLKIFLVRPIPRPVVLGQCHSANFLGVCKCRAFFFLLIHSFFSRTERKRRKKREEKDFALSFFPCEFPYTPCSEARFISKLESISKVIHRYESTLNIYYGIFYPACDGLLQF